MDYSSIDSESFIDIILNSKDLCPCLMIGREYVNKFKHKYRGNIEMIYNLESVRGFLDRYSNIAEVTNGKYLVLEGIGSLSEVGQNSLLKFIEESKLSIILLSFNDNVSPIIMSRCKVVVKRIDKVESLDFMRVKDALVSVKDKRQSDRDFRDSDEVQFYADNCPAAYGLSCMSADRYDFTNSRIRDIIVSL